MINTNVQSDKMSAENKCNPADILSDLKVISFGGERGVLGLFITSADVSRGCWQASVLGCFLRIKQTQGIANNLSSLESEFATYPFWRQVTSRFVEHLTNSSAVHHAVVHPSFSTAYCALIAFKAVFSVCQCFLDIAVSVIVSCSWTLKAFKGKGQSLHQSGLTSGLGMSAGVLA